MQILSIQLQIAFQDTGWVTVQFDAFIPHAVGQSFVINGDGERFQLDLLHHGNQLPQIIRDLLTGHIGDDQGQNPGCQIMQFQQSHVPAFLNERGYNGALAYHPLLVAANLPDPGVGQGVIAHQRGLAFLKGSDISNMLGQVFRLFLREDHIHAVHGIDDFGKGVKADLDGVIHRNAEILFNALSQHFHAALGGTLPGAAQGITDVNSVSAAGVTGVGGQGNIEITQEGNHGQGIGFPIDGAQKHGVRQLVRLILPVVLAHQHNVGDILVGYNLGPGILRRRCGRLRFLGSDNGIQFLLRKGRNRVFGSVSQQAHHMLPVTHSGNDSNENHRQQNTHDN